jgi:hypothetical protein
MKEETGIRVTATLRNKIKRAALLNNMNMNQYLNFIVPDVSMKEIDKEG